MASGFPLTINGINIPSSEALYQACRYPHKAEIQTLIFQQKSGMAAKMKSKLFTKDTRPDWDEVKINVMRWCLHIKLAQNFFAFGRILESTGNYNIVESSAKDAFWGALETDEATLVGKNVLGRLLMELRRLYQSDNRYNLLFVEQPKIHSLMIGGQIVKEIDERLSFIETIKRKWKEAGFDRQETSQEDAFSSFTFRDIENTQRGGA